jgi:hypothetical protein
MIILCKSFAKMVNCQFPYLYIFVPFLKLLNVIKTFSDNGSV